MRILIIDDEADLAQTLKISLQNKYFAVDTAEDGERGSFLARTNDYDLIVLDLMLPKQNGLDTCREIRSEGKVSPILVLSARTEVPDKVSLLDAGADDYLTKPFSLKEFHARVSALLRRPREIRLSQLIVGDLVMYPEQYLVQRAGKNIDLTRKEFMLLEYLLKNQGIVLARTKIMEHVWDINVDPFSNTLETHIMSLRKKIESPGRPRLIQTISSQGYKLEPAQ